jgi:meso-butanediol dehydrogenase/(S,S)-butanediol dehydrogenase/diacetyl reductase
MSVLGKVAIVTGAGTGIGRATTILFSQKGAKVALVGRRLEPLRQTVSELHGNEGLVIQADVSKQTDAEKVIQQTVTKFGKLDILVNNAGVSGPHKTVPQMSEAEWNNVLDINLKGAFLCSKFAIPAMKTNGRGVITNVASNWGIVGAAYSAAYCVSKAGVILLTKCMAIDHARDGIVVNCICPGDTDTPMIRGTFEEYPDKESRISNISKLISPEEIAHAILYLVSDEAVMTTGTTLVVDNGATVSEGPALLPSRFGQRTG